METFERKPGTFRRKWGGFCAEVARCADGLRTVKEKQEGETKKREPSQANETIPEGKQEDDRPNGASVGNQAREQSGEQCLDFLADGAPIGTACEALGGHAHDFAHFFGRSGADFGDDLAQCGGEFLVGEGFGQIGLDDGHFCQFALGEVGTILLGVEGGGVTALLCELGQDLNGGLVGEFAVAAGSGLRLDEVFLDVAEGLGAHFVVRFHGRHDVGADLIEKHSEAVDEFRAAGGALLPTWERAAPLLREGMD